NTENSDSKESIGSHAQDSTTGSEGNFFTQIKGKINGLLNSETKFPDDSSDTKCLAADDKKSIAPSTEEPEGFHEDGNELQESSVADIKDQDVVSNTENSDSKESIGSHAQDSTTGSEGNFFTQIKGKIKGKIKGSIKGKINGLLNNEAKFSDDSSDTKCLAADDKKSIAPSTEEPEGFHEDGNELQESSVADIKDQDVVSNTENSDSKESIGSHAQDSTTGSEGNFFTQIKGKINGLLNSETKFPDDSSDTKCLAADDKKSIVPSTEEPEGFHEDGDGLQESSVADVKDQDVVSSTENDDSKGNVENHVQDSTTVSEGKFFTRVIGSANGLINKFSDFKKAKIVSHNSLAIDQQIAHEQEVKIPVVIHACDKLKTNYQMSSNDSQLSQGGLVNVNSPVSDTDSSSKFAADDEHRSENENLSFGDDVTDSMPIEFCEEAIDYIILDGENQPSMVTTNGTSNASQPTNNVLLPVVCRNMSEVKDVSESDSYEGNSCNGISSDEDNPSQEVKGLMDDHQVGTDHHSSDSMSQDLYGLPVLHEVSIENDNEENSCVDKKDLTHDPSNDSTSKLLDSKSNDISQVNADGLDGVSQNEPSNNTVNSGDIVLHQDVHDLLENESTMERAAVDPDDTVKHKDNKSILSMFKRKLLRHTEKSSSGEVKKCEDDLSKDTAPNIINEPEISNDTVTLSIRDKELEEASRCVDDSSGGIVSESVCATHSETGFEVDTTDVSQCQEKKSYFSGVGDAFQKAVYNIKDTFSSSKKDDSSEAAKKTEEEHST
ncbi:integral membrane protein, partial [Ehrlichia ruminantium]